MYFRLSLVLAIFLLLPSVGWADQTAERTAERTIDAPVSIDFSQEEIDRLERGEAVTDYMRYVDKKGDQAGFAVSSLLVGRPAEEVWAVLLDIDRYHEFFPGITRARIVKRDGDKLKTHMNTETYILKPEFTVDMTMDSTRMRMIYSLDKTAPVDYYDQMDGFWQVTPWTDGSALATYRLAAGVDFPIPDFILQPVIESLATSSLPKVMRALADRVVSISKSKDIRPQ